MATETLWLWKIKIVKGWLMWVYGLQHKGLQSFRILMPHSAGLKSIQYAPVHTCNTCIFIFTEWIKKIFWPCPSGDLLSHNSHWTRTNKWWSQSAELWKNTDRSMTSQRFALIRRAHFIDKTFPTWLSATLRALKGSQAKGFIVSTGSASTWEFENYRHF